MKSKNLEFWEDEVLFFEKCSCKFMIYSCDIGKRKIWN